MTKSVGLLDMVVIDVEDGIAWGPAIEKGLASRRRIVEEAIAAVEVAAGVMTRRTAKREYGTLARCHHRLAGQRHIGRGRNGSPSARGNRRAGIEGVVAQLAVDRFRLDRPHATCRPIERQR